MSTTHTPDKEPSACAMTDIAKVLSNWPFNHAQPADYEDGVWVIGIKKSNDCFSPVVEVDTGLYFQDQEAKPLARAILSVLSQFPKLSEENTRLRGEADVMVKLRTSARRVVQTAEGENAAESEMLADLLEQIDAVLEAVAKRGAQ